MAIDINIDSQVQTYNNLAAFPATGVVKTIYIAEDTDFSYYWDGTAYIQLSGGSNLTLQDVTDEGNTTTNNIEFDGNVGLIFDNGSKVTKGTTDSGTGGSGGVALKCSIDYELKWEAGNLYVLEQDGFTIREVKYKRAITPYFTDDSSKGFVVGSRWILDNGATYTCTDNSIGSASWNLEDYDSQDLQSVTDFGNITTNSISVENAGVYTTLNNEGVISTLDSNSSTFAQLNAQGYLNISTNGTTQSFLQSTNTTQNVTLEFPDKVTGSYTIATVDDIPTSVSVVQHAVKAGEALTKGQAVYVSSANGTNMIVSKASNTTEGLSSKTMGLITTNLALNGQGYVITEGLLAGLNTNSANVGDPVWLGTNGNLIYGLVNKPYAPAHLVYIGIVTRKNANNGEIFVRVQNGFEVKELHDVSAQSPSNGDSLVYNSSNSLWEATTTKLEVLHAWDSVNSYDYMGVAKFGTATSATTWTITRIIIASNGTTTKGTATGSWDNRASLTYV